MKSEQYEQRDSALQEQLDDALTDFSIEYSRNGYTQRADDALTRYHAVLDQSDALINERWPGRRDALHECETDRARYEAGGIHESMFSKQEDGE